MKNILLKNHFFVQFSTFIDGQLKLLNFLLSRGLRTFIN